MAARVRTGVPAAMLVLVSACSGDMSEPDAGAAMDAGAARDAATVDDAGTATDAAATADAGSASDGGTPTDAGAADDAGTSSDAGIGTRTPCGATTCDRDTEMCFECACGGPTTFSCVPVPAGCADDRTCGCAGASLCTVGLAMCTDRGDNHVFCDSGLD